MALNRLPGQVVDVPSLDMFNARLFGTMSKLFVLWKGDLELNYL